MSSTSSARRSLIVSAGVFLLVILALFAAFLVGRNRADRLRTVFEQSSQKGQLASAMRSNLQASAAAEKSAVMAETDEASKEFADASRRATAALEADRSSLAGLVETRGHPEQLRRLSAFNECWTRCQEIDREVLGLAVENTNLKALNLSFSPATEALDRMQSALNKVIDESADSAIVAKSAYRAMTAALKIHSIEGRHIAEPRDEEMNRIEAEMKTLDGQVTGALIAVSSASGDGVKPTVEQARVAYADFQKVNAEVLRLSRRNTNVRSLALSLGQKRKVTAECLDLLSALQESLETERSAATR